MSLRGSFIILALIGCLAGVANGSLLISGVSDGTQSGGIPKSIELYATADIADLSTFSLIRDTNGAGPFDSSVALPAVMLSEGDFFYVASNAATETILNGFGFTVGLVDGIAGVNGDDILGLALTSDTGLMPIPPIDSFGLVGQGDTNFYTDSFAIRMNSSTVGQVPGLMDAANFTITPYTDNDIQGAAGYGTYSPVPEPGAAALLLVGLAGLVIRRRS